MRKLHLWLPMTLLSVAVATEAVLHYGWKTPPPDPLPAPGPRQPALPATDAEPVNAPGAAKLAEAYRAQGIPVATAPCQGDSTDAYIFFGDQADPLRTCGLSQGKEYADCWNGVILARFVPDQRLDEVVLGAWGDCGMRTGPYLLFGDPAWIARSREVLAPQFPARG
jgi:hypothetical protein